MSPSFFLSALSSFLSSSQGPSQRCWITSHNTRPQAPHSHRKLQDWGWSRTGQPCCSQAEWGRSEMKAENEENEGISQFCRSSAGPATWMVQIWSKQWEGKQERGQREREGPICSTLVQSLMYRSLLSQFCPACRASPLSPSAGNELRLGTELQAPGRAESWLRTVLLQPCRTLSSDHSLPAKVSECLRHSMLWPAPAHSHHSFYTFSRGLNLNTQ